MRVGEEIKGKQDEESYEDEDATDDGDRAQEETKAAKEKRRGARRSRVHLMTKEDVGLRGRHFLEEQSVTAATRRSYKKAEELFMAFAKMERLPRLNDVYVGDAMVS